MTAILIVPSENIQDQSPLLRLPNEIKHMIFRYCFATEETIVDAIVGSSRPEGEKALTLGVSLLRTCRRVYHEADRRPLYAQNIFRFTSVDRVRCFFNSLDGTYSTSVHDIEIDARRVHSKHPGIAREWLHYLAWSGGTWANVLESFQADAPHLKCLRLNFESWPFISVSRPELWNFLRTLLMQVEGLERIMVIGASKGAGMARREPWSPVHFVGGDDVGSDDLVQRMWAAVGKPGDSSKIIRWSRGHGKIQLEVVSVPYLTSKVDKSWNGPTARKSQTEAWPENGSCTWKAYTHRHSSVPAYSIKDVNHSVSG
ncbi:hypothetical protein K491DRAFT_607360 [Lophiostoma macrostomum CBS 122681]|uniref:F-box domain-containing protein n=1 Tax=Lophiostoma macrostomum CBS 122681 TaxID=1314788 RepID=A0A6A6SU02_9PLEO|nr:hypothetical protein K491DRAFT_607360 [Lophiostoma macrostomum CBS 122681]